MGQLPQHPVELAEAPFRAFELRPGCRRGKLRAQPVEISSERRDVLECAVVKIEAEPRKTSLARLDECALVSRVSLQQEVAFDDRTDRSCRLFEQWLNDVSIADAYHQRGPWRLPASHWYAHDQPTIALGVPALDRLRRDRAKAPCRRGLSDREHTIGSAALVSRPERRINCRRQGEQHRQLHIEADERRQLE